MALAPPWMLGEVEGKPMIEENAGNCPFCGTFITHGGHIHIIAKDLRYGAFFYHVECKSCTGSHVVMQSFDHKHGEVNVTIAATDLTRQEAEMRMHDQPITPDNVIDFHAFISRSDRFDGLLSNRGGTGIDAEPGASKRPQSDGK